MPYVTVPDNRYYPYKTYAVTITPHGVLWALQDTSTGSTVPHRVGGPAHEQFALQVWYRHGRRHRTDGPAWTSSTSARARWFLYGEELSQPRHTQLVGLPEHDVLAFLRDRSPSMQ